ncbi:HAMP domain-containing histidine kinase [Desulfobacter latus]|uniref:HAMP domain-containing histidine kinase n=1 Tax=Desulfobacter latus TaxID=2292 RepID=A0A850SV23_9BACT|nr:HAMP domain-containing histidine kinase [Desulfobacter latus]NWH03880.1 HAMP domain-containing histidine kinase [Desulfobacter latus]
MDMEKKEQYNNCLKFFRETKYAEALPLFNDYLQRNDLTTIEQSRTRYCVAACLLNLEGNDTIDAFNTNLEQYIEALSQTDQKDIAPPPSLDCFGISIRYSLKHIPLDKLAETIENRLKKFVKATEPKITLKDYLDKWKQELDAERRNYSDPNYNLKTIELANGLLKQMKDNPEFTQDRAVVYNILADIYYFSPPPEYQNASTPNAKLDKVRECLDNALQEVPNDLYAKTMKQNVDDLSSTALQIRRFQHDTNTRLGNIGTIAGELLKKTEVGSEWESDILTLKRELEGVNAIGRLIKRQKPGPDDWSEIDMADLVTSLLKERRWPPACSEIESPAEEEIWPEMMTLALDNLMRNTEEAYTRQGRPLPDHPCNIRWIPETRQLVYTDFAGGIDPALGDIFEPYNSSKGVYDNVGLGLTQTREALRIQGFDIALSKTQPDGGAEFIITLQA